MITRPYPCAVLYAKDTSRLVAFYQDVAAMQVIFSDQHHTILEIGGFQLIIHAIPERIATTIEITQPPEVREDATIKLCLPASSIAQARQHAALRGGCILPSSREWSTGRIRACDGYDPEGNVFQVREACDTNHPG